MAIKVGVVPAAGPTVRAGRPPEQNLWAFSFRFFRQMRYFGVGGKDAAWFSAVLDKLGELSKKTVASTFSNPAEKVAWRLHEINWTADSIPIQRAHLDWIDAPYLSNAAEYPIHQFQITKALGRVVGFFDERKIFNIVLLDPMHNAQPSDYSDHKVRATIVSETTAAAVIRFVEARLATCKSAECVCRAEYANFQQVATNNDGGTTLLVHLSADLFFRVTQCVKDGAANSIEEIIGVSVDFIGG